MHARGNKPHRAVPALLVVLLVALGATYGGGTGQKAKPTKRTDRLSQRSELPLRVERPIVRRASRYAAPDRVLVRFRDAVPAELAESLLLSYGFPAVREIRQIRVFSVRTPPGSSVTETLARLRRIPDVEQARPDFRARLTAIPNDTFFSRYQYNLSNRGGTLDISPDIRPQTKAGADIKATAAWDAAKGAPEVAIAVLDSGVDRTHPDLAAKVLPVGRDFANGDDDATDDNWHGTHVAGIAAADTNNGEGVAGVAWNCKILAVKVSDAEGAGYYSWIIEGLVWAADQGAKVVNLSMGGDFDDPFLEEACKYAHDKGVVIVASAGNDFGGPVVYPAAYDDYVLAVTATDYNDEVADFSSSGAEVDVAAPGVYILGPAPQWYVGPGYLPYVFASGTSQAAPHVAGLAALIMALKPDLGPDDVMKVIRYTADDVNRTTFPGRDDRAGFGRINMAKALVPTILK